MILNFNWRTQSQKLSKGLKHRDAMRKSRYGLSPKQFEAMKLKQDNSCAICKRPFGDKTPHVDHDHISGEVRGLLCHLCNKALGAFKDDPIILERALNYVKKSVKVSSNGDKL